MIPDSWCCMIDMGEYDLILLESMHYQTCESYRSMIQPLNRLPVEVKLKSHIRELTEDWIKVDLCSGVSVEDPRIKTKMEIG